MSGLSAVLWLVVGCDWIQSFSGGVATDAGSHTVEQQQQQGSVVWCCGRWKGVVALCSAGQ